MRSGWLSSAMYIVGTPSNTVTRSRWITSSTRPASKRGTRLIVAEPDAQVEDAGQPEDVEQRQDDDHHVVVPDSEQAARGVGVHEQLEVTELCALRPAGLRRPQTITAVSPGSHWCRGGGPDTGTSSSC